MNEEIQDAPDWAVDQPDQGGDNDTTGSTAPDWAQDDGARASAPEQASEEAAPDWARDTAPEGEWSQAGSAAAGAAKGAVPGIGGMAAGLRAGASIAAATSEFGPLVAGGAGIVGGLAVGLGASQALGMAQDKFLALMGWDKPLQKAHEANPNTFDYAEQAPGLALLKPNLKSLDLASRGIGAGIGAAAELGTQALGDQPYDFKKVSAAAAAGGVFTHPNALGSKVIGESGAGARYRGSNKNPDLKVDPEAPAPDMEFGDLGPAAQEADMAVANKQPDVAGGVATEQQAAPPVERIGNEGHAGGAEHTAAGPNDPKRNFAKGQPETQPDTIESKVIDTEPLKSDVKAALEGEQPPREQVQAPAEPDVRSPEPAPTTDQRQGKFDIPVPEEPRGSFAAMDEAANAVPHTEPVPEAAPEAQAAPLKPEELQTLAEDRKLLAEAGWTRALEALNKVAPREQLIAARKGGNMIRQEKALTEGKAKSEAEVRRPTGELRKENRNRLETGAIANSKKLATKRQAALDAYNSVYDDFGPKSETGKGIDATDTAKVKPFTKSTWEEAKKRLGGDPFAKGSGIYIPVKRTEGLNEAIQWLKAVKASATGQNHKTFATLHSAPGMGALDRETGRVAGDIAHQPQVSEAGAEIGIAKEAEGRDSGRQRIEDWSDPNHDESAIVGEQQQTLRDWINDLEDVDYNLVKGQHPDLESNVRTTQDPDELLRNLQDELGERQKVRPPSDRELQPEVELPPKKIDLPHVGDEPKKPSAYEATAEVTRAKMEKLKALRLAQGQRKVNPEAKIAERFSDEDLATDTGTPADGTWSGFQEKVRQLGVDETASGKPMFSWTKKLPTDPVSPDADATTREVVKSVGHEMNVFAKSGQAIRSVARAILQSVPKQKVADAFETNKEAYRWLEDHPDKADDAKITDPKVHEVAQITRDTQAEKLKIYDEIRRLDPEGDIIKLPPVASMKGVEKGHVSRMRKGDATSDDTAGDVFKTTNRSLSPTRDTVKDRELMVMTDGKGTRVPFTIGEDGKAHLHWNRQPPQVRSIPEGFEANVGDKLTINLNKKPVEMTVDNATVRELRKHVVDKDGKPYDFHESPVIAEVNALIQAQDSLDTLKFLNSMRENKDLLEHSIVVSDAKSRAAAAEKGYIQTKLKQFQQMGGRDWMMDRRLAEIFDDYRQAGFDEDSLNKARATSQFLLKTLFVMNPAIHGLNVGASWGVQRGWDIITPEGNKWLAKSTLKAIKMVLTQDKDFHEMAAKSGLTLMLPGTRNSRMMQSAANRAGIVLQKNPNPLLDKAFTPWGLTAREVGQGMQKYTNTLTWAMTDTMTAQRFIENMERHGMSPEAAAAEAHEFLPDYTMKTRVNEKVAGDSKLANLTRFSPDTARMISKGLREPAISIFAPYHTHLFGQLAQMTEHVVSGTKEQRIKAAGQIAALAVGMYMVYPYILDKGAQKATGNEHASVGRRGPIALAQAASDHTGLSSMVSSLTQMLTGKPTPKLLSPPRLSTDVFMPSIAVKAGLEGLKGEDYAGHPIWTPPRDKTSVKGWAGAAAHVADWALGNAFPPYQIASSEYKKDTGRGSFAGRMLEEQVGIRNPTPQAIKYGAKEAQRAKREEKAQIKHPGPLQGLVTRR